MAPWRSRQKSAGRLLPASPRHDRPTHLRADRRRGPLGHPGRGRQGQGAARPQERTSSASGPASPTSPPRRTSWPPPRRPAATREPQVHADRRAARSCGRRWPSRPCGTRGSRSAAVQVLVTNGGKQAVANAFATLCDPGDEVLVLAPYWTTYPEVITLAGGVPVVDRHRRVQRLPGHPRPARGGMTRRAPRCCCSCRRPTPPVRSTRATRSRPSGGGRRTSGLWVVTDEIYEHLVYGDAEHHSMPVVVPELADRCIVVNGVAKTYAMTGWRVGWMIGPADVITAATNLQSHETSNVANVVPAGGAGRRVRRPGGGRGDARGLRPSPPDHPRACSTRSTGSTCILPEGAFYAFPSVDGLLGRRHPGPAADLERRAGRAGHRRGQGGRGAGRGVRRAGLLPDVLRPGRRRPGRGRLPPGQAVRDAA